MATVLVTGSTDGLGRALAGELAGRGHELTFHVNYLAGFLLTLMMLPPRTVNVASIGQRALDFDDLMLERGARRRRWDVSAELTSAPPLAP